jgi:hypothetical protein
MTVKWPAGRWSLPVQAGPSRFWTGGHRDAGTSRTTAGRAATDGVDVAADGHRPSASGQPCREPVKLHAKSLAVPHPLARQP